MRATVYGRKLLWGVNPIYPGDSLVYYNHNVYDVANLQTAHGVYYIVQGIRDGVSKLKTIEDYSIEDLERIALCIPEFKTTIKSYIKHKKSGV